MHAGFKLGKEHFMAMETGLKAHKFDFTQAFSFAVNCSRQKEVDFYWQKLSKGGKKGQCGWLEDKYGVSWQVDPVEFEGMIRSKDSLKAERAIAAMMKMSKLDLAKLKKAFNGTI